MIFCRNCGYENPDNSKYCAECGKLLENTNKTNEATEKVKNDDQKDKRKDPLGASLLNLIIAGIGMAYLGQYAKAVLSFIIVWFCGALSIIIFKNVFILAIVGYIFIIAWTYDEAKKYNKEQGYD